MEIDFSLIASTPQHDYSVFDRLADRLNWKRRGIFWTFELE
jgi:hypothetical protein